MAPDLVFPAPEADIEIEAMTGARVSLRRRPAAGVTGWRAAYSLQAWPRDNNSRRQAIFLFSTINYDDISTINDPMPFSARDLFNSSGTGNKVAIGENITVEMSQDYVISIISNIGDVKKEFKLRDIMKENASLLPLHYSDVRDRLEQIFRLNPNFFFLFQTSISFDSLFLVELLVSSLVILSLSFTLVILIMSKTL